MYCRSIINFDIILTKNKILWSVNVDNYTVDVLSNLSDESDFISNDLFNTYEEALEIGLQEALKII